MTLEERVAKIEERNKRVEKDKAWETSKTRIVLVFILTYVSMIIILTVLRLPDVLFNALIVAIGFLLSTLTLPWFRALWEKYIYRK